MPPKAAKNASIGVFVVVSSSGVDSVYATGALANERAEALKAEAADASVKVEHYIVKEDEEKPAVKAATKPAVAKKTKSSDEQRAANVEKPGKSTDADLPANMKALLAGMGELLTGKSIVVTGVPPTLQRKNAEKLVMNYGGKLVKSISKNTSFVVLGNDAGPKKLEQIEELGIETLDEDAFIAMLEEGGVAKRAADDEEEEKPKGKKLKK